VRSCPRCASRQIPRNARWRRSTASVAGYRGKRGN